MKRAFFPGTFDPFTNGHLDIVNKGLTMFDEVVVAIGVNALKKTMFDLETRLNWIQECFKHDNRVRVVSYEGLTIKACKRHQTQFILRGLRTAADFEYEKQIALVNSDQDPEIQSVFVLSEQQYTAVSSTVIRDLIRHGGDFKKYLPDAVDVSAVQP